MRVTVASIALLTLVSAAPFEEYFEKSSSAAIIFKRQSGEVCGSMAHTVCPNSDYCAIPRSVCCTGK